MEKFYLYVAVPASLILIIQTLMTFMGLSGEIDVDYDGDGDVDVTGETGLTIFSVRNLIAFFTFFGWSGVWLLSVDVAKPLVVLISILIGLIFVGISMSLFFLISKMQRSGNVDLNNAIGLTGEVYIRIPESRKQYGKVMLSIQGALGEYEAVTDDDLPIPTGTQVQVVEVVSNAKLLVKKL